MTSLRHYDIQVDTRHLDDDYDKILETLTDVLVNYDLVILSGGVSKGKFDFLPDALAECGVEKHFHKIKQRPGKPFWFGSKGSTTVFAFPGNPVSSFMCMQQYFIPWLEHCIRMKPKKTITAELAEDVYFKPDLTYFLEVRLDFSETGKIIAQPVKGNGSGDLANLVDADAFIKLPMGRDTFSGGETFPLVLYRIGTI
jgi:molybdopterin molybdotransferase